MKSKWAFLNLLQHLSGFFWAFLGEINHTDSNLGEKWMHVEVN